MAGALDDSLFADTEAPICSIPSREAFLDLSHEEKLYTHHMCRASFHGTRILLRQTSQESEGIFDWIVALCKATNGDWKDIAKQRDITTAELEFFLEYACMFFGNAGNYRSTGDTKFIPRASRRTLERLSDQNDNVKDLFKSVAEALYSEKPHQYGFSKDENSASGYYPGSIPISKDEVDAVDRLLARSNILPENTRISKTRTESEERASLTLQIASSELGWLPDLPYSPTLDPEDLGDLQIQNGDHAEALGRVVNELNHARGYASGQSQKDMIDSLVKAFRTGDHAEFKSAQSHWVRDKSPAVESVIGFIETYQDPQGIRGAWEGIIAVTNRVRTKRFSSLVDRSDEFIVELPWNGEDVGLSKGTKSAFENPHFNKPDFTSLDTIGFVKSESPAGLNLPNFEDICQSIGSKNLEFGNVNKANPPNEKIPFIRPADIDIMRKHREDAFEMLVACHELLGHGSGRLLAEDSSGNFNFSVDTMPINPLTGAPITSWYKPGETWSSVFGADANALEECRADGVSLLLLTHPEILKIFGYTGDLADDMVYVGYLDFLYGTLKGLSRWNSSTKKWGQSHRRGKFALMQCMLRCGEDALCLDDAGDDLFIFLDRSKILTHIIPALSDFLRRIQVYKSTANVAECVPWFEGYTRVDEKFMRYRSIILAKEPPRIQYVQPNTILRDGEVTLQEYPATKEGLIQSWIERGI